MKYYKNNNNYDVIDICKDYNINFNLGNVLKYVVRAGVKTPDAIQDLEKAKEYLNREIDYLKNL